MEEPHQTSIHDPRLSARHSVRRPAWQEATPVLHEALTVSIDAVAASHLQYLYIGLVQHLHNFRPDLPAQMPERNAYIRRWRSHDRLENPLSDITFEALGLSAPLLAAVNDTGYTTPTPVQAAAIPLLMEGHDLLASAATGTGKTAAFLLPSLMRLANPPAGNGKGPRVLIMTPTRELTQQVATAAMTYGKKLKYCKVVSLTGGTSYITQNKMLSQPYEIMVATPGRLIDQMNRGRVDFSRLEVLILDEADRMLDMGFREDIEMIASALPGNRQTMLFSATLDGVVGEISARLLNNPQRLEIAAPPARDSQIEQKLHYADGREHKLKLVQHLIGEEHIDQAIVFTATKRDAEDLADELVAAGVHAASLHGDLNQRERNRTITRMKRRDVDVLVATDVAARGLDVAGINLVINFDLPRVAEDYVHRIGRTGRAGKSGVAVSLVDRDGVFLLRRVERFINKTITPFAVDGLEARFSPKPARAPREGGGGRNFREGGGGRNFRDGNSGGKSWGQKRDSRPPFAEKRSFENEGSPFARPSRSGDDRGNGDRAPRSFGDRGNSERAPRSFGDRGNSERAPRSFGEHGNSERAPRSFGDRGNSERAPRSFGDRPTGDRPQKPFGKPGGDRFAGNRSQDRYSNNSPFENRGNRGGRDQDSFRFPSDSVRSNWEQEYQRQKQASFSESDDNAGNRAPRAGNRGAGKPWTDRPAKSGFGGQQGKPAGQGNGHRPKAPAHSQGHTQPTRRSSGWFPSDRDFE